MSGPTFAFGWMAGIAATLTMDLLGKVSRQIGLTSGANPRWIGRWFLGLAGGRFFHADISLSPQLPRERMAARVGHYAIGIVLAEVYLAGTAFLDLPRNGLLIALAYGWATNVFPWFLMFPAMGYGLFGRNGPAGSRLFASSLVNHLFYGFGLWWTAGLFVPG